MCTVFLVLFFNYFCGIWNDLKNKKKENKQMNENKNGDSKPQLYLL